MGPLYCNLISRKKPFPRASPGLQGGNFNLHFHLSGGQIVDRFRRRLLRRSACPQLRKKTGHAVEQDRSGILRQRRAWFDGQLDLDPERLVFADETWTATNITRSHGRCASGERLRMGFPHGHRKTTTLVAGLRLTGMAAPMVLGGPINGEWFKAYAAQVLALELRRGDNLSPWLRTFGTRFALSAPTSQTHMFLKIDAELSPPDQEAELLWAAALR